MTDYRARIREILDQAYDGTGVNPSRHDAAERVLVEAFRDLTRDLSEELAQLKLADADRAARELGVGEVDHRAEAEQQLTASRAIMAGRIQEDGADTTAFAAHLLGQAHVHLLLGILDALHSPAAAVEPGPCPSRTPGFFMVGGKRTVILCQLRAGHAGDHEAGLNRWNEAEAVPPDAVSAPSPVPASETAREGGGEAHSGVEGVEGMCACGHPLGNNWFDREVCPQPCGVMHTRCNNCGKAHEPCPNYPTWPLADVMRADEERSGGDS